MLAVKSLDSLSKRGLKISALVCIVAVSFSFEVAASLPHEVQCERPPRR